MATDKELLDQLLDGRDPQDLFAKDGLIDELKKALSERMLAEELDDHLGSEAEARVGNRRNGTSKKTMLTGSSKLTLDIPRDRSGALDPKPIAKYQRRFPDFDDKIISIYARGMTVREIRPGSAGGLRGRSVGCEISGHRAELAAALGAGHPVLRFQRAYPVDHLHHECYRGAELEAAPSGSHPGSRPR